MPRRYFIFDFLHPEAPPKLMQLVVPLNDQGNSADGMSRPGLGKRRIADLGPGDFLVTAKGLRKITRVREFPIPWGRPAEGAASFEPPLKLFAAPIRLNQLADVLLTDTKDHGHFSPCRSPLPTSARPYRSPPLEAYDVTQLS